MVNNKLIIALFYLTSLIVPSFAVAQQSIFVAVGWDKPPYVMNNARTGFEVDLLRDIFKTMEYDVQFIQIPYGRSYDIFNMANIDAVATLSNKLQTTEVNFSDVYIQYQNVVVTLASSNIKLESVADMAKLSIVGFQSAFRLLGEDFLEMATNNSEYREIPDQARQLRLLFSEKAEAIVLDVNIFNHVSRTLLTKAAEQPVVIHPLFSPNLYRVGFRDPQLQFKFNQALTTYLSSDRYVQLSKKYHFYQAIVANGASPTDSITAE